MIENETFAISTSITGHKVHNCFRSWWGCKVVTPGAVWCLDDRSKRHLELQNIQNYKPKQFFGIILPISFNFYVFNLSFYVCYLWNTIPATSKFCCHTNFSQTLHTCSSFSGRFPSCDKFGLKTKIFFSQTLMEEHHMAFRSFITIITTDLNSIITVMVQNCCTLWSTNPHHIILFQHFYANWRRSAGSNCRAPIIATRADRFSWCFWRRFSRFLACPLTLPTGGVSPCLSVIVHLCSSRHCCLATTAATPELQ